MSLPTQPTRNLKTPIIKGSGLRIEFTKGDGDNRLIAVTEGSDIKHPVNGYKYKGNLKFGRGDQLTSIISGSGSCHNPPYPTPLEPTISTKSNTYVVYDGDLNGDIGIDILNLRPSQEYNIIVYEHNGYCYLKSDTLKIITSFITNMETFEIQVYDNRTRLPIQGAEVKFIDPRSFMADKGYTDELGKYRSIRIEEGRYTSIISCDGYETKTLMGLFIQREEPRRDSYYRIFTSAGNTEMGSSVERKYIKNKNIHKIYLDPFNTINSGFNKYQASPNPSNITKL